MHIFRTGQVDFKLATQRRHSLTSATSPAYRVSEAMLAAGSHLPDPAAGKWLNRKAVGCMKAAWPTVCHPNDDGSVGCARSRCWPASRRQGALTQSECPLVGENVGGELRIRSHDEQEPAQVVLDRGRILAGMVGLKVDRSITSEDVIGTPIGRRS